MLFISNIQHFSIGDGPGIRTTVYFQGCLLHCPWCHNPEMIPNHKVDLCFKHASKQITSGRYVTLNEILPELLEDKDYYDQSKGGVTLSGGEVLLQADEAAELSKLLVQNDVSVIVDTSGNVPYTAFEKIDAYTSGYLFDYKSGSSQKYQSIGGDLSLITTNLESLLSKDSRKIRIRIPLIPYFNINPSDMEEICRNLVNIGIKAVDLLPFHRLGSSKYSAMGEVYTYSKINPLTNAEIESIKEQYEHYFSVMIER